MKNILIEDYYGNEKLSFKVDDKGNITDLINCSIADETYDNEVRIQEDEDTTECSFFREKIYDCINNIIEDEKVCKMTDKEVDSLVNSILDNVMYDDELISFLNNTIEWYAKHYIAEHFNK